MTRGRPRDQELTERALLAARDVMLEEGFEALSFDRVADAAQTSRSAIYRRWESKIELAYDVLEFYTDFEPMEITGNLIEDLVTYTMRNAPPREIGDTARLSIWALIVSPDVLELYIARIGAGRRKQGLQIVNGAVERGELPVGTDANLLLDLLIGLPILSTVLRDTITPEPRVRAAVLALTSSPPMCAEPAAS
ncbi:TetR/AcrR family transcriptional regulator [Leucobacter sp. cx-328]|uniref:TetR/AcrR family transcriptional regulator n=1 Tax=unclassified Leucobacter TaxID=2621730 RepID=UPI00165E0462|nr:MULTISPECIES: TetR/AcrR family transcriptional regulator [unclassified Leucobacter]MBC9944259.1 TetR/AcrR family transcriptional regulator [Leucobacter sp. cx-328]